MLGRGAPYDCIYRYWYKGPDVEHMTPLNWPSLKKIECLFQPQLFSETSPRCDASFTCSWQLVHPCLACECEPVIRGLHYASACCFLRFPGFSLASDMQGREDDRAF